MLERMMQIRVWTSVYPSLKSGEAPESQCFRESLHFKSFSS
jgi:hypothetical protein